MKRKRIIFSCIIAVLLLSLCPVQPVVAKTKKLKGYVDIDKTVIDKYKESGKLCVHLLEKGKKYSLRNFLNTGKNGSLKEDLLTRIKKKPKQQIALSGVGFKIKKQTFQPQKEGLYMLKVETNEVSYIFPIYAVNKEYKVNLDEVDKISITIHRMGNSYTALVEEPLVLGHIVDRINRADYSFNFEGSMERRVGNTGFTVGIQWKNGRVTELDTLNYGGFSINNGWVSAKWSSDSQAARDFVDYIGQVFDDYLPKHRGERSIC